MQCRPIQMQWAGGGLSGFQVAGPPSLVWDSVRNDQARSCCVRWVLGMRCRSIALVVQPLVERFKRLFTSCAIDDIKNDTRD